MSFLQNSAAAFSLLRNRGCENEPINFTSAWPRVTCRESMSEFLVDFTLLSFNANLGLKYDENEETLYMKARVYSYAHMKLNSLSTHQRSETYFKQKLQRKIKYTF